MAAGAVTINYGLFINAVIRFVIVAFAIFILVKQIQPAALAGRSEGAGGAGPNRRVRRCCWPRSATCSAPPQG